MTAKWFLPTIMLALCWLPSSIGFGADGKVEDPGRARNFSAATLAKVTPGKTTKAQVESLLGRPWRTVFADDPDEPGPLVWEYRGKNSHGTYLVHIEFDRQGTTTRFLKMSDKSRGAPGRVAKTPSRPDRP